MLKGFPCKVTEYSTAKPGKHGSAKATIVGVDIFTGKKHEDSCPTGANILVPIVNKCEYQVIGIDDDGFLTVLK
jgi:translation initiation factor 5A